MKTPPTLDEYRAETKERLFVLYPEIASAMHLEDFDFLFIEPAEHLLTSHEATIRQEIGEKVEEILFKGTSGNASHDTAIKELWERMFKPAVLAVTNQTL